MSLSYLAGLVSSDGHLEKNRPYVCIYTKNENFRDFIVELLRSLTGKKISSRFRKRVFQIRVHSRELYDSLNKTYLITKGKKCDKLIAPKFLPLNEQLEYLKSFLDGDSSIFKETKKEKRKTRVTVYSYPVIELKTKSKEIVEWSKTVLESLGLKVSKVYQKNDVFYWRIRGASMITKFKQVFRFEHPIKKEKLENLVEEFHGYCFSKRVC